MSFIGDFVSDIFGGGDAADAARDAAAAQEGVQREALARLEAIDQPLLDIREEALPALSGFFGLGGGDQQALIEQVQQSPFYDFNVQQAEEAVLRNAAATGGLRSGDAQRALAETTTNIAQDLVNQHLQGLSAFAFPSLTTGQQANILGSIGQTRAGGILGAEQAQQSAFGQGLSTILGGLSLAGGLGAFGGGAAAGSPAVSSALGASQVGYGPAFGFGTI